MSRPSTSLAAEWPGYRPHDAPGAMPANVLEQISLLRLEVRELQARIDDMERRLGRGTL